MASGLSYADPLVHFSGVQPWSTHSNRSTGDQGGRALSSAYDQLHIWEHLHQLHHPAQRRSPVTSLARALARRLEPQQNILELGCGNGADAAFLSQCGHAVTATDFSEYAIETARSTYQNDNLVFQKRDLRESFDFGSSRFDIVYARLSIHYFSDMLTRKIVGEVGRVLIPGGRFLFMCKSTQDPLYGKGELIAPRIYCYEGHIRHFFDVAYTSDLLSLDGYFNVERLQLVAQRVYGLPSSVIICHARRVTGYRQPRLI